MISGLREHVWQVVALLPRGRVATYGQVAQLAGFPRHARAVGTILSQLPESSDLPWHRVINARGEISFAPDSNAYRRQKSRLEAEGIVFRGNKVPLRDYGLDNPM